MTDSPNRSFAVAPLAAAAVLLLISLGERWPTAGALTAVLLVLPLLPWFGPRFWIAILTAAFLGGMAGAALAGTELTPPGGASGNIAALVKHTARLGLLEAVWVGGGLSLIWHSVRRRSPRPPLAGAPGTPGLWSRALPILRPFRLAALLLLITVSPLLKPGRDIQAYRAAMVTDLVSLSYFEARHYAATGAFTTDPAALAGFRPSPGVAITIQLVDSTRWRGRALHEMVTTACAITAGARDSVAVEPSDPICREQMRWF